MNSDNKFPNFLESLFLRQIHKEAILPYPTLDEDDQEFADMMLTTQKKFIEENINAEAIDHAATIDPALISAYAELGFFAMTIPEEFEGAEAPYTTYCKIYEDLCRGDASFSTVLGGHQSLSMKPILLAASKEQKERWLPKLAEGEFIGAFALTEPSAGSDVHNLKSVAEPSEDGTHYILNGEKLWITNGSYANFFTYFTRVPRKQEDGSIKYNIACMVVTRDMEGVSTGQPEKKMGLKGSATTTVTCQNVKVPVENLVGGENDGFMLAMQTLNYGRLSLAASTVGVMKEMLKRSREFAEQRVTFGKKIINHGMVAKMVADMEVDLFVSEALAYLTAGNVDRGQPEFQLESAATKTFCTEACWRVINNAVQINGGMGYMSEYPYERALRDARINTIFEGTNEIQRMFIALFATKKVGKMLADGLLNKDSEITLDGFDERLTDAKDKFIEMVDILSKTAIDVTVKFGKEIVNNQLIQKRLAEMAIYTYASVAAISKTQCMIGKNASDIEKALKITNYFTQKKLNKVKKLANAIWDNQDDLLLSIV